MKYYVNKYMNNDLLDVAAIWLEIHSWGIADITELGGHVWIRSDFDSGDTELEVEHLVYLKFGFRKYLS